MPEGDPDLALLCQSCGLCCDGSLFGRVDLDPGEGARAAKYRLRVLQNGHSFEQPCSALTRSQAGGGLRRCSMYAERPLACRHFVCRLYERHRREGGSLEGPLSVVRRARRLLSWLEASALTAADFDDAGSTRSRVRPSERRAYLELTRTLEEDFRRA